MRDNNATLQQGTSLITGSYVIPQFNQESLILAIRKVQAGHRSRFLNFFRQAGKLA